MASDQIWTICYISKKQNGLYIKVYRTTKINLLSSHFSCKIKSEHVSDLTFFSLLFIYVSPFSIFKILQTKLQKTTFFPFFWNYSTWKIRRVSLIVHGVFLANNGKCLIDYLISINWLLVCIWMQGNIRWLIQLVLERIFLNSLSNSM